MKPRDLTILLVAVVGTLLLVAVPIVISRLGASLEVEHAVPGSRIENLRWVDEKGEHGRTRSLLPGESAELGLGYFETGQPRRLRFDLVVDGARVVLTSQRVFVLEPQDEQRLVIDPAFAVTHPMTASPPAASNSAAR